MSMFQYDTVSPWYAQRAYTVLICLTFFLGWAVPISLAALLAFPVPVSSAIFLGRPCYLKLGFIALFFVYSSLD